MSTSRISKAKAAMPPVLGFLVIALAFHVVGAISTGFIEQRHGKQIT